jgi:hypothetical protein
MLFEEFFKKKKINLVGLNEANAGLFAEFKDHYEQMGEKSFDHTKKYWFNKLRRQFPLPAEPKIEKFKAENQIAEQTVADTLTEPTPRDAAPDLSKPQTPVNEQAMPAAPAPKLGFKPKFKSATTPQPPAAEIPAGQAQNEEAPTNEPEAPAPKKPGFTPRFKAGVTAATKPEESTAPPKAEDTDQKPEATLEETAPTAQPKKPGFTPRFKAGVTAAAKPAEENTEQAKVEEALSDTKDQPAAEMPKTTTPKIGFTPRFKAGVTQTKFAEEETASVEKADEEISDDLTDKNAEDATAQPASSKLGFKPRFKAGVTTSKPAEEPAAVPPTKVAEEELAPPVEPSAGSESNEPEPPAPKPAYKPRFTPNMIKRKPPETD